MNPSADDVQRLLSLDAIRQLPARYALAVDSRDVDTLTALFVKDVQVTHDSRGHAAMRLFWERVLTTFGQSFHFVGNHIIDYTGGDLASGVVYCRAEHQVGSQWIVQAMIYLDSYRREDGLWKFERRRPREFYGVDWHERPQDGALKVRWPNRPHQPHRVPENVWPTFSTFFERAKIDPATLQPKT